MTFSCLHLITVLFVAWNTLQALSGLYAIARTSFIVRQNRKASRLTTRLVLKIVFSHMRPLQEHEEEDIKEVTIQFYRQAYNYISHYLTSTSGFATATNHLSLDSQFTSYLRSTNQPSRANKWQLCLLTTQTLRISSTRKPASSHPRKCIWNTTSYIRSNHVTKQINNKMH
jgi:hypothetical protein